jgi:L-malate glycosyltransferase
MMTHKPITVLHFTITEVRGGVEEHILLLLRGLDRKHFRPMLVCPVSLAEKLSNDLPTDTQFVGLRSRVRWKQGIEFAEILHKYKVDILHSHMFQASRLGSPIGRVCGVPLIVETTHVREHWRKGWINGSYIADRLLGHFVDYFIAVSEANARYLIEEKKLPQRKVQVIRNGCDFGRLDPTRAEPVGLRKRLGFEESDPVLLFLGRLEPQKGHRVLLEALQHVQMEFPAIRLVCAGDGALRGELEERAPALGISSAVRFVGYQSNVADWLALADITVLPSFYEGLPLFAVESLASAKPMVATAVDGTEEVVMNGKTGLTVPPDRPMEMAEAIRRLLRQPDWAKSLGRSGQKLVLEQFSQERQVRLTNEFYLQAWDRCQRARNPVRETVRISESPTGSDVRAIEQSEWISRSE